MEMLLRIWYTDGRYEEKIVSSSQIANGVQLSRNDIEEMIIDFVPASK